MIHATHMPDVFQPHVRQARVVAVTPGGRARDYLPGDVDPATVCVWLNGKLLRDAGPVVRDGDYVHSASVPQGPVAAALPWLLGGFVVSMVAGSIARRLAPKQEVVDTYGQQGGSAYSYFGFRNSYRPEGDAVPVVYGTMRIAPPCINQSVTGALVPSAVSTQVQSQIVERLNVMYALSHGPILGLGNANGEVRNYTDWTNVALLQGDVANRIGMQINGLDAPSYQVDVEWRTGSNDQEPVVGLLGAGQIDVTNPGTSYNVDFTFGEGDVGIDQTAYPAAKVAYADRIQGQPDQSLSLFLSEPADQVDVQVLFPTGLYTKSAFNTYAEHEVVLRVQYWRTDSSDTTTSDVVILPPISVAEELYSAFSRDLYFPLYNPDTYVPSVALGYYTAQTNSAQLLCTGTGYTKVRPLGGANPYSNPFMIGGFFSLAWSTSNPSTCSWLLFGTNAAVSSRGKSWTESGAQKPPVPTGPGGGWDEPGDLPDGGAGGFSVHVYRNTNKYLSNGQGSESDLYLVLYAEHGYGSQSGGSSHGMGDWWVSEVKIGNMLDAQTEGGVNYWPSTKEPNKHITICVEPQGISLANTVKYKVHAVVDGQVIEMKPGASGAQITSIYDDWAGFELAQADPPGFMLWLTDYDFDTELPNVRNVPITWREVGGGKLIVGRYDQVDPKLGWTNFAQVFVHRTLYGGSLQAAAQWLTYTVLARDTLGNLIYDVTQEVDASNLFSLRVACAESRTWQGLLSASSKWYANNVDANQDVVASGGEGNDAGHPYLRNSGATVGDMPVAPAGPVFTQGVAESAKGFYHIEVFREAPVIDTDTTRDRTTIKAVTTWDSGTYEYPGVAYMAASVTANDQIKDQTPAVTVVVNGRLCRVYTSVDPPQYVIEHTHNPAWIALDMLLDQTYGVGDVVDRNGKLENVDLQGFYDWSLFCSDAVKDAFGELLVFGVETESYIDTYGDQLYGLALYVGILDDTDAVVQTPIDTWQDGSYVSITAANSVLGDAWVTINDRAGGLNLADGKLLIRSQEDVTGASFHGWQDYRVVHVAWNRYDEDGNAVMPNGVASSGYSVFADEYNAASLLTLSGAEERCQFDGVFDAKTESFWDALIMAFQSGRAMPMRIGSQYVPVWDAPRDPVALVTMANVLPDSFQVSYLSPKTQPNSVDVEFLDRDRNYTRTTVTVDHESLQESAEFQAVRKDSMQRLGITRRSQAIRDAYWRLNRYHLQRRVVEFELGPDALHLVPGDRVLLSHDVPQYGYSGRLAGDAVLLNAHPGSSNLHLSLTANGGECQLSRNSVSENTTDAAPLSGYSVGGVTHMYGVPTAFLDGQAYPAGAVNGTGKDAAPWYAQQHVALADGAYPLPGNVNTANSPLDQILSEDQVLEFSVYVKEPDAGASKSVLVSIYRYVDFEGYVQAHHGVRFDWSAGALVFGGYFGEYNGDHGAGTASPYGLTYTVTAVGLGWYRVVVLYDNGDTANGGAGADAVGDYVQARLFFCANNTTAQPQFQPLPAGRGNNLLRYADPLNLDGTQAGTSALEWFKAGEGFGSNEIATDTSVAPPFYPDDVGAAQGPHGRVVRLVNNRALSTQNPMIWQSLAVPSTFPGAGGAGDLTNEKITATVFVRLAPDNACTDARVHVRISTDSTIATTPNLWPGGNYINFLVNPYTLAVTTQINNTGGQTITSHLAQATAVRLNSTTNDADWIQVDCTMSNDANWTRIQAGVGVTGLAGGDAKVNVWGMRLHGEGGTGSTGHYVNPYVHQGALAWGPMYVSSNTTGTATDYADGATLLLDRDVPIVAGNQYEVLVRSSTGVDVARQTDLIQTLAVEQSEVPASGIATKADRVALRVSTPKAFLPEEGDVFSFGRVDAAVLDVVVTEIDLKGDNLTRHVRCLEYSEAVYDDTKFGTLGDKLVSDLALVGPGGAYGLNGLPTYGRGFSGMSVTVSSTPMRKPDGQRGTQVRIEWQGQRHVVPPRTWRVYVSRRVNGTFEVPYQVAEVAGDEYFYQYINDTLVGGDRLRAIVQPVGASGGVPPLYACPSSSCELRTRGVAIPAPVVSQRINGFSVLYRANASDAIRVAGVEARIGGWIISTPAFEVDGDARSLTTMRAGIGGTNAAGDVNFPIVARSRTAEGYYGNASVTVDDTVAFEDVVSTTEVLAEDAYATELALPLDLAVASGELHWSSSSSATDVVVPLAASLDLTKISSTGTRMAQRVIVTAMIQGYQVHGSTVGDLDDELGSDTLANWSVEGPMLDDPSNPGNASVTIEWRWTSSATLTTEPWREFAPQTVWLRRADFRLRFRRPSTAFDTYLQRFNVRVYVPPVDVPLTVDVDGGTF